MNYDRNPAVKNTSFSIEKGDYLCIVGENGSGKSTLMKGILGLMKVTDGEIKYTGINKNEIGDLPQQTDIQRDFPASVYEVVLSGCLNQLGKKPFYSKKEKQKAEEKMKLLKISDIAKKSYMGLSGGQQQRVLLARALCAASGLIILDEPVTGLDPVVTAEMYFLIEKINKENEITVVMVSHDIGSAVKYGSKILHMNTEPEFFGTSKEYLKTDIYKRMTGQK
jgi:zinc transport system ATP-binding protein